MVKKIALARSGPHGHRTLQKPARLRTAAVWCLDGAPVPPEHTAIPLVSLWLRFATQARIAEIKEAVNNEMKVRIEAATVTFKDIVQSPSAIIMEGKIAGLSRQGKVKPDEPRRTLALTQTLT